MANQNIHKVGYYIRVSTEEQAINPEGSIKNQEDRLHLSLRLKNSERPFGELAGIFIDRGKSGKDTNRPELQRLLSAIRNKEVSLVMVSDLSRLSRSIKDFSEIWELMKLHGCDFLSLRESFDTTTAAGEMVLFTLANLAQFERKQTAERVTANIQARAARGLYNGGVIALGYQLDPDKKGHLAIDYETVETVRAAFRIFLEEGQLALTAKRLNREGYAYKKKLQGGGSKQRIGHFTVANLSDTLRNPIYIGVRRYFIKGIKHESKAVWLPIIDDLSFERVQKLLKENVKRKPESESRYNFLLSGKVVCGECGSRMVGKSAHGNVGKVPYYEHSWHQIKDHCMQVRSRKCTHYRVPGKILEPLVWEEIKKILEQESMAKSLLKKAEQTYSLGENPEIATVKNKIKMTEEKLSTLTERLSELPKNISATPIYNQMERLQKEKEIFYQRLFALEKEKDQQGRITTESDFEDFILSLKSKKDLDATSAKQAVVRSLVHKVEITHTGFKIYFYVGADEIKKGAAKIAAPDYLMSTGSTSLTNGGPCRT